ncbi:MAG: hypothetical protein ACE5J7_05490 [Candidatus Aenigmatarchaeota archaeon]
MAKAKESGVYEEEKIEDAKEVLYSLIDLEPRTFGGFRADQYSGSPFYHTHFLGICIKRLKEEGRIAEREIIRPDGKPDTEFYAIEGMVENIKIKAKHFKDDLFDSFVSLYKKKWVEEDTDGITKTYSPGCFSSYLTFCTMQRNKGRKSGWKICSENRSHYKRVKGKRSTVSGDVTIELDVLNSRGDGPWYDEVSFNATFRRAKKEEMRILPSKHKRYLKKIFNSISEISLRSQVTELYADRVIVAAGLKDGSVDVERLNDIVDEVETLYPDKHWDVVEPMVRNFYAPRVEKKSDLERHEELVIYLRQRIGEKTDRLRKRQAVKLQA